MSKSANSKNSTNSKQGTAKPKTQPATPKPKAAPVSKVFNFSSTKVQNSIKNDFKNLYSFKGNGTKTKPNVAKGQYMMIACFEQVLASIIRRFSVVGDNLDNGGKKVKEVTVDNKTIYNIICNIPNLECFLNSTRQVFDNRVSYKNDFVNENIINTLVEKYKSKGVIVHFDGCQNYLMFIVNRVYSRVVEYSSKLMTYNGNKQSVDDKTVRTAINLLFADEELLKDIEANYRIICSNDDSNEDGEEDAEAEDGSEDAEEDADAEDGAEDAEAEDAEAEDGDEDAEDGADEQPENAEEDANDEEEEQVVEPPKPRNGKGGKKNEESNGKSKSNKNVEKNEDSKSNKKNPKAEEAKSNGGPSKNGKNKKNTK